jgi:hypothetical protein
MLNKLFVRFVTQNSQLLKFALTVVLEWGNISVKSANSSMMIRGNNSFIVMIVGSAELVGVRIISIARSAALAIQLLCVIIIYVWRTP